MSKPYVLASDFDGTLKQHATITKADRQAIQDFRAAGHRFGVITGRSHTMIASELLAEGIPVDFLVCNNGALIYDADARLLEETVLDPRTVQGILALLDHEPDILYGASGSHGFFSEHRGTVVPSLATQNIRHHAVEREAVLKANHVTAFYLRSRQREHTLQLAERIVKTYPDVEAHVNSDTVDIGPKGHDKGTGILKLAALFPDSEIVAIGDHLNDLPMIKAVYSFAIASGHPDLQDHAENVVTSVSDCITHLLQKK